MEKMRILAIDDNSVCLATIEQELSSDYEVIPVISGRRAIKYLYMDTVDLILLDVDMPIMDGITTLREIRTQPNGGDVPVIFLTSKTDKNTVVEGAKLGIMDYIIKPIDGENLKERIDVVLKRTGKIPVDNAVLYSRVMQVVTLLKRQSFKPAIKIIEEILNYQMDEEISGRMKNVLEKLKQNNHSIALGMTERVAEYIDKSLALHDRSNLSKITEPELIIKIKVAVGEVKNFYREDAIDDLNNLKNYDVGLFALAAIEKAVIMLENYDDVSAIKELEQLLQDMNAKNPNPLESKTKSSHVGFHSTPR